MNLLFARLFGVVVALASCAALAQHVDILVWDNGGAVGVGEFNHDDLTANDRRVHLGRLNSFYSVDNPGFTALSGSNALPGGEELQWSYLPMTVDSGPHSGYRSTLLYWDGKSATPEFGPTATDEYEFSIFGEFGSAAATGLSDVELGSVIAPTPPNGSLHVHPFYYLDDNGDGLNTTLPEAGIYVVALEIAIGDLTPSAPVFLVWATPEISVLPDIQPAASWVTARQDTLVVDGLLGDFNADGLVNAADYAVWRDIASEPAQTGGYALWAENFGAGQPSPVVAAAVPEPSSFLLLMAAVTYAAARVRD